jgi:(p)ppGpp synthase/HD superfamily hydrolase
VHRYRALDRAILFAESAHRGQLRKGTQNPYVSHVIAVAMIVLDHGHGIDAAIVGLLHDVIEDTPVDRDEIEGAFGEEIARAVLDLSEQDKAKPWEQRKSAYIEQIRNGAALALPACAADKIHNLRSILWDLDQARAENRAPEEVWRRFKRPPHKIAAYHRAVERVLAQRGFTGSLHAELDQALERFAGVAGVDPHVHVFVP